MSTDQHLQNLHSAVLSELQLRLTAADAIAASIPGYSSYVGRTAEAKNHLLARALSHVIQANRLLSEWHVMP